MDPVSPVGMTGHTEQGLVWPIRLLVTSHMSQCHSLQDYMRKPDRQ